MIIHESKEKEKKMEGYFSNGDNHASKGNTALLETTFLNYRVS